MLKLNGYIRLLLTFLAIASIIWLGGEIFRTIIGFDIFIPGTELVLKPDYTDVMRVHSIYIYANISFYTVVGFYITFICMVILFFYWRKILKQKGWLFMTFILFFLSSVVGIYLSIIDIKLMLAYRANPNPLFSDYAIQEYFLYKMKNLSVPSGMAFLANISILIYLIWKPLNNQPDNQ
jgi:hypothetical protein